MKTPLPRATLFTLFLLSATTAASVASSAPPSGTPGIVAPAFSQVESEPNDGPLQANELHAREIQAEISVSGEHDYFSVIARAGETITVETFDGATSACGPSGLGPILIDTEIEILGPDGSTTLSFNDDNGSNWCSLASATVAETGRYFIRVSSSQTWCSMCRFDYRLLVSLSGACTTEFTSITTAGNFDLVASCPTGTTVTGGGRRLNVATNEVLYRKLSFEGNGYRCSGIVDRGGSSLTVWCDARCCTQ